MASGLGAASSKLEVAPGPVGGPGIGDETLVVDPAAEAKVPHS